MGITRIYCKPTYLEDHHPMTCKWLITMVIVFASLKDRIVGTRSKRPKLMAYKNEGDPKLLTNWSTNQPPLTPVFPSEIKGFNRPYLRETNGENKPIHQGPTSSKSAQLWEEPWLWHDLTPLHLSLVAKNYTTADVLIEADDGGISFDLFFVLNIFLGIWKVQVCYTLLMFQFRLGLGEFLLPFSLGFSDEWNDRYL